MMKEFHSRALVFSTSKLRIFAASFFKSIWGLVLSGATYFAHANDLQTLATIKPTSSTPTEFRIVMEPSPPLQFIANDKVTGSVATKVKNVFQKAGISAQLEVFPWSRALNLAQSEANMFISNIARTPERENLFKWVDIVYSYQFALIATNDIMSVEGLEEVKSYTIAVQRNDVAHHYLEKQGFSVDNNLFLTSDISESWKLLNLGHVDFVVEDMSIVDVMAKKHLSNGRKVSFVLPIQDLTFDAWLAANLNIDDIIIARLAASFD